MTEDPHPPKPVVEQRVNIRRGGRLIITLHGQDGYVNWLAAAGDFQRAGAAIGVHVELLNSNWPNGRPR